MLLGVLDDGQEEINIEVRCLATRFVEVLSLSPERDENQTPSYVIFICIDTHFS